MRLKPHLINDVIKYPVYIRVTFKRENQRFASQWINYPLTENEFNNTQRIKDLCNYEKSIIEFIIDSSKNIDEINISSRLTKSVDSVIECFIDTTLNIKETKNQIINYIIEKTELTETIINPYVNFDYLKCEDWNLLNQKVNFDDETKKRVYYLAMLIEFENKKYKSDSDKYEVNGILNFYEWEAKSAKTKFIDFAKLKNFINNETILKITQLFDLQIKNWFNIDNYG